MQESQDTAGTSRGGDRRGPDRRGDNRRRTDRRSPPPYWRRPWAFVAYGVAGAAVVFALLRPGGGSPDPGPGELVTAPQIPAVDRTPPPAAESPTVAAYSPAEYERLVAEGESALGQRVQARLFCGSITSIALRTVPRVPGSVAELADAAGRVPAAECKWGAPTGAPDFLLLVPPDRADRFAAAPEVEEGFVRRRRVTVEVEWIGRSDALALRTAGVLREFR